MGLDLGFDPTVSLGPFRVAWHSLWSLVGMGVGSWLSFRLARALVKDERIYPFAIAVVIGGLLAARIGHIADNWPYYGAHPDQLLAFWNGGVAVTAAPIGSAIGGWFACRRLRLPPGFMFDITVIGIVLGEAIGRIGDIINGEHHAIACGVPGICVTYDHPDSLGQGPAFAPGDLRYAPGPVHLAVGYEMLWDLAGVALALVLRRRLSERAPEGRIFWLWLAVQSLGRFLISFLRVDKVDLFGLYQAQLVSLALIALAIPILVTLFRMSRTARPTPA